MRDSVKIVGAAVGAYVLGRRKKFKLAMGLGLFIAGKQLKLDPQKIAGVLMKQLGDSPQIAELREQAQGQLVTVGKAAAGAVIDKQASRVADALQSRTERLNNPADESDEADEADEAEDTEEAEDTGQAEDTSDESEDAGEEPEKRETAQKQDKESAPAKRRAPAGRSQSGSTGQRKSTKSTTTRRRKTTGSDA